MTNDLAQRFQSTRKFTENLTCELSPEDCMVQSTAEASPTRWHLAHTTWFFETFVLSEQAGFQVFDDRFSYLFNSYYNTIGAQFPQSSRGLISRPSLSQIRKYRQQVNEQILVAISRPDFSKKHAELIEIGIQHEQQHQELILTDIKHALSCNPTWPKYQQLPLDKTKRLARSDKLAINEGVYEVGHPTNPGRPAEAASQIQIGLADSDKKFAFDNECPRHKTYLHSAEIDADLVTCGDYLEFIQDDGYRRPEFWLSTGWNTVRQNDWQMPMYWHRIDGNLMQFTLAGLSPLDMDAPVSHVSFFEADAYARYRGRRLPTEFEWEVAASSFSIEDDAPLSDWLLARGYAIHATRSPQGYCGGLWQWTSSNYLGYPGYRAPPGAVGEYNGKFMCDQHVLRGGSVATHRSHIRPTYRNFFPASTRWQFSGIRLAN